jgi:hypothetical protein
MSMFENPTFYVSIFSSICFVASEILPFLPTKGNGIFHTVIELLSKYNKTKPQIEDENKDVKILNEKMDILISKLSTSLAHKNTNTV